MPEDDDHVSRAELADPDNLVDIARLQELLAPTTQRREKASKAWANEVARDPRHRFPAPLIRHRRLRLWLLRDVQRWVDAHTPDSTKPPRHPEG